MMDFSKGPIALKKGTIEQLRSMMARELPSHAEVSIKNSTPPQIRVREGLWRGVSLFIEGEGETPRLSGYQFRIPSFLAMVILFIASVAVFSLILMVVVSAVVGEFVPAVGGIGGIAGVVMYSLIEKVVLRNIKGSWLPDIERVVEKLKA